MNKTREILDLFKAGFTTYSGTVPPEFYIQKKCQNPKKAEWFLRPWSKHEADGDNYQPKSSKYICLGCNKRCIAIDPVGWQLLLPMERTIPGTVIFAPVKEITADELLTSKRVLRIDEAGWVLNVSRTTVYSWIQEGLLDLVQGTPARVTSDSVKKMLNPVLP